jgi:hypothetical protein
MDYFENLYSNKLENIEEVHKLVGTYAQTNLYQEDIKNLKEQQQNKDWRNNKVSLQRKIQYWTDSLLNFTRPLKKS